ncbi:dTDP-4-dehydrorhamnose 3,5-epimerase [Candidatus Woesearchaeota archaeon]|nr:dTDP-4-dehydrorhamnose 3,5-epimerase [Candidatus Woesearchaeota archaeon]
MPFEFKKLRIPDVILITPKAFEDERGFFLESYKRSEFEKHGIPKFVQDNHSKSKKNVLRGLHYQLNPVPQGKLVRCIKGKIFDVAVDIRKDSETYSKWVGVELSEENKHMLWIPPGFAHGYLVLEDDSEIQYKVTEEYSPEHDRGIIWSDPEINLNWPINNPILSEKDKAQPLLKDAENNY